MSESRRRLSVRVARFVAAAVCIVLLGGCLDVTGYPILGPGSDGGTGPVASRVCTGVQLAVGCRVGWCTVSAPIDETSERPILELAAVEVTDEALRAELVEPRVCQLNLVESPSEAPVLRLTYERLRPSAAIDDILVEIEGLSATALETTSTTDQLTAFVDGIGIFGPTASPSEPRLEGEYGNPRVRASTDPGYWRGIAVRGIQSAFFDGARLYVGNGRRILVFRGLPGPTDRPAYVLGQPDLESDLLGTTSSLLGSVARGIWGDDQRLVVASDNRVLIWSPLPTETLAPADLVLGQPDFNTNTANAGGVSAASFFGATQVDGTADRLAVADFRNNRVLWWSPFPTAIREPATGVMGQPDFESSETRGGATELFQAWGVSLREGGTRAFITGRYGDGLLSVPLSPAINPAPTYRVTTALRRVGADAIAEPGGAARVGASGLGVRDITGKRIAVYANEPVGAAPMDLVLGQPDLDRVVSGPVTGSTIGEGEALTGGGGLLLVPDRGRLLGWFGTPPFTAAPADYAFGQPGFAASTQAADYRGTDATSLAAPAAVARFGDEIAVADRANNRVLLFDARELEAANPTAHRVLGQGSFDAVLANRGGEAASLTTLSGPAGLALNDRFLVVADSENHRVLVWRGRPGSNGAPADLVLGQRDGAGGRPNHGNLDSSPRDGFSDADASGLFFPVGVSLSGSRLAVADRQNHRVLIWNDLASAAPGAPADLVIGQASATDVRTNRGQGPYAPHPAGFHSPSGVAFVGGMLWVADTENNRLVRWRLDGITPQPEQYIGQPDGSTLRQGNLVGATSPVRGMEQLAPPSADNVVQPWSVSVSGTLVLASERGVHRVHLFDSISGASQGILGQPTPSGSAVNAGGIGRASLSAPEGIAFGSDGVLVADSGNHRVLRFPPPFDVEMPPADGLLGQSSFGANGFNRSSNAAGFSVEGPSGMALVGDRLFIADTNHHRVLEVEATLSEETVVTAVYGQPDGALALPNSGDRVSDRSLRSPRDVAVTGEQMVIADTENHRVLLWNRGAPGARVVLGQATTFDSEPNRGQPLGPETMHSPAGVATDGTALVVADTANHRVLVWSTLPTRNGQPPDRLLGQPSFSEGRPNAGRGAPSASTMVLPTGLLIVDDDLWVSDTGNNRVLIFEDFLVGGPEATRVLGQTDFTNRRAATSPDDSLHLSGPAALATDSVNVYVLERDLRRIVIYRRDDPAHPPVLFRPAEASLSAPRGLAAERTSLFTTRLYIANSEHDHITVLEGLSRLR